MVLSGSHYKARSDMRYTNMFLLLAMGLALGSCDLSSADEQIYWDSGRLKAEGRMIDGKEEGLWKEYYESGEKRAELNFKDGLRQGHVTVFWTNGKKKGEGEYLADQYHGHWMSWYENEMKEEEGELVQGKEIGSWRKWRRTGSLESESLYLNGLLDGPQLLFDSLGRKRVERWYSKDILKSEVKYTEEGFAGDPKFLWNLDELPLFRQEYIKLSDSDTILKSGVEYRFTVGVPGIPEGYFRTEVTNATVYRASQTEFGLKARNGHEACISLVLSLGDTIQIPYGKRCFSVRQ